jgi:transcriptional regulator with XRE-family HTH domain
MQVMLRTLRKRRKLSLETLAERADLSVGFLSRVERGQRELGNKSRRRVAGILGVPETDLQSVKEDDNKDVQEAAGVKEEVTDSSQTGSIETPVVEEAAVIEAKMPVVIKIMTKLAADKLPLLDAYVDALIGETGRASGPRQRGTT